MTSSTDALSHTTLYSYNTAGLIREIEDPRGFTTSYTYDTILRVDSVSSGNTEVNYTYSKDDLTEIDVDGNQKYIISYDDFGRKISVSVSNPNATSQGLVTYTYNNKNQLASQTYANGKSVSYTYDNVGRVSLSERSSPHLL